ncbi:MAG: Putative pyridoxal phosphate-dependent aminotransferase EpsN [Opitutia bacterium UBA7350]|nr:MAG: Putative pyridoxal phosphate-dependent aminotransferase EpsN [Opitutae bacterium UBA7350]
MSRIYLSPPDLRQSDHAAVGSALASNWVAPVGPELALFESKICQLVNRESALAVNSGTAALHLALEVIGVGEGDIVLCSSFTFAASANPIVYCGATPVFIGSEHRTWNMDAEALKEALETLSAEGTKPKAVIVVQLYGQCAEMNKIEELCAEYGIPLIEDAAEALGASYKGRPAGSFGDFSFFSFNGNKIITTSAGGMLLSNNKISVEFARSLSMQAREPVVHYEHQRIGYNYRMSNVLAALGRNQLGDLKKRIEIRKGHYEAYREALEKLPGVTFMPLADSNAVNYWLTCLTFESEKTNVAAVVDKMENEDIELRPLWKPLHLQPVFKGIRYFGKRVEETLFLNGICLPSGSSLTEAERLRVIQGVRGCF